jgi:hypothetical protein
VVPEGRNGNVDTVFAFSIDFNIIVYKGFNPSRTLECNQSYIDVYNSIYFLSTRTQNKNKSEMYRKLQKRPDMFRCAKHTILRGTH